MPWLILAVLVLSVVPVSAQTWSPPPGSYVIGNTVMSGTPTVLASGKGHRGGGAPAPSPSPAPSPAPAQSFSGEPGRAESGFTYPQYRVQVEGPPVAVQLPSLPPASPPELPPITVQPIPPGQVGGGQGTGCCAPYATLTIPVQLLQAGQLPTVPSGVPPYATPQPLPPGTRMPRECPAGCMQIPEGTPTPQSQTYPPVRQRICNALGHCILWP
jgi:hypothetical protein